AGVLQGGIVTALLDFAMAFAAHAKLAVSAERPAGTEPVAGGRAFATASLTVHFMRPAPPGRYVARGRIVRAGRRLLFAEAQLDADGGPIASASAVLPIT
ncbi:MAG: PaaI family thioesterase, partial [Steroidobacteraceae bacterium]